MMGQRCVICRGVGHNSATCNLMPEGGGMRNFTKDQRYRVRLEQRGLWVVCGRERDRVARRCSRCLEIKRKRRQVAAEARR